MGGVGGGGGGSGGGGSSQALTLHYAGGSGTCNKAVALGDGKRQSVFGKI